MVYLGDLDGCGVRSRALKPDILSILEAIYAEAPDEGAWIRGVLAAGASLLDCGYGVAAGVYAVESDGVLVERLESS